MSLQYIHTSARRGLEPGKSGFCCVARNRELPVDLGKELERLSRYEHIAGKSNPVILRHLKISIRSGDYHILSRLSDAGADYSKRNNHIAHHLVFTDSEVISLPDPATILLFWKGWRNQWNEPPRVLVERDQFTIQDLNTKSIAKNPVFESQIDNGHPRDAAFTIEEGQEFELALHFRNELLSLPTSLRWDIPFTNFILTSDQPTRFTWRGNWKDRPLPFEFEPILDKAPAAEPIEPADPHNPHLEPTPADENPAPRFAKFAPKVEIPQELNRSHRKRPKLRWTRKRFSKTLNLSLSILAVLCIGTIGYLLLDFRTSDGSFENPAPLNRSAIDQVHPTNLGEKTDNTREEWTALLESNRLYEKIDVGLTLAKQLSDMGDSNPMRIAQTLSAIKGAIGDGNRHEAKIVYLSNTDVKPSGNQWFLEAAIASAIQSLGFALAPEPLFSFFEDPLRKVSIFQPLSEQLHYDRFIPEDMIISLKAVRRAAKDRLVRNGPEAVAAAEDYQTMWQALEGDESLASLQKLETVLNLNPVEGYFAIDDDGLLRSLYSKDISTHIKDLYEQFMLPRFSSFKSTPEFRDTIKTANLEYETTIGLAKAIYQVLLVAEAFPPNLESKLELIRSQWSETFVREDLMEETIINFNLERLANSKRRLLALQSQFSRDTWVDLNFTSRILASVQMAESSIQTIGAETTWGLVPKSQ